jgi:RNA polymerase sigma factor (sigma-70 family)
MATPRTKGDIKMKKQKHQKKSIREIEVRKNYSGESSPYRDYMSAGHSYMNEGDVEENAIANPDMLSEDDNIFHRPLSELGQFQLEIIQAAVKKLSVQQQKVLYLCGQIGLTQAQAAKELHISQASVNETLQRVRRIIQRQFEEAKKEISE